MSRPSNALLLVSQQWWSNHCVSAAGFQLLSSLRSVANKRCFLLPTPSCLSSFGPPLPCHSSRCILHNDEQGTFDYRARLVIAPQKILYFALFLFKDLERIRNVNTIRIIIFASPDHRSTSNPWTAWENGNLSTTSTLISHHCLLWLVTFLPPSKTWLMVLVSPVLLLPGVGECHEHLDMAPSVLWVSAVLHPDRMHLSSPGFCRGPLSAQPEQICWGWECVIDWSQQEEDAERFQFP